MKDWIMKDYKLKERHSFSKKKWERKVILRHMLTLSEPWHVLWTLPLICLSCLVLQIRIIINLNYVSFMQWLSRNGHLCNYFHDVFSFYLKVPARIFTNKIFSLIILSCLWRFSPMRLSHFYFFIYGAHKVFTHKFFPCFF